MEGNTPDLKLIKWGYDAAPSCSGEEGYSLTIKRTVLEGFSGSMTRLKPLRVNSEQGVQA